MGGVGAPDLAPCPGYRPWGKPTRALWHNLKEDPGNERRILWKRCPDSRPRAGAPSPAQDSPAGGNHQAPTFTSFFSSRKLASRFQQGWPDGPVPPHPESPGCSSLHLRPLLRQAGPSLRPFQDAQVAAHHLPLSVVKAYLILRKGRKLSLSYSPLYFQHHQVPGP